MTHRRSFLASVVALPVASLPLPAPRMSMADQFRWIRQTAHDDAQQLVGVPSTKLADMTWHELQSYHDQYLHFAALARSTSNT